MKLLTLIFFFSTSLFASSIDEAIKLKNQGKYLEAIPLFEQELNENPNNSDALLLVGLCYSFIKNFDRAIDSFERGLAIAPEYHDIRIALGRVLSWKGDYSRSELELLTVIDRAPHLTEAYLTLANTFLYQKKYDDAIFILMRGANYEQGGELKLNKAKIMLLDNRHSEALLEVDELLKRFPKMSEAYALKGRIIFDDSILNHKMALNLINLALEIDATNTEALLALGDLHTALWNFNKAKDAFNQLPKEEARERLSRLAKIEKEINRFELSAGIEITNFSDETRESFKDLITTLLYRITPYTTVMLTAERALHYSLADESIKFLIDRKLNRWLSAHLEVTQTPSSDFKPKSAIRVGGDAKIGNGLVVGVDIDHRDYNGREVLITSLGVTKYGERGSVDLRLYDARTNEGSSNSFRVSGHYDVNEKIKVGVGYASTLENDDGTFAKGFSITGEGEYSITERNSLKFSLTKDFENKKEFDTRYNLTLQTKF